MPFDRDRTAVHVLTLHFGRGGFALVYAYRLFLAGLITEDEWHTYVLTTN